MEIGYARVSTEEQNLALQKQALKVAGCKVIIEDQGVSGTALIRPGLSDALARAKKGDVLATPRSKSRCAFSPRHEFAHQIWPTSRI